MTHAAPNGTKLVRMTSGFKLPRTQLPSDFQPSDYSVICGQGKQQCFNAVGNRRFRIIVDMHLERYSLATTKNEKTQIVREVVDVIRNAGGGFVKFEDGLWYDVGDTFAREKVGALFRDRLHLQYRSSAKAKVARRRKKKRSRQLQNLESSCSSKESNDCALDDGSLSSRSTRSSSTSSQLDDSLNRNHEPLRVSLILEPHEMLNVGDLEIDTNMFEV